MTWAIETEPLTLNPHQYAQAKALEFLLRLVARDEITVVLDQSHDLDGIVEAHRRVDTGHKVGNVVVRPCGP